MIACLVLGSGGAVPTPDRAPAGCWIAVDGRTVLVDPGPGAVSRLLASPHGPGGVDGIGTVLLSHLHIDHCADLAPLLFALHSPIPAATGPLVVAGPPGLRRYLDRLRELYGDWLTPVKRELRVHEIGPGDALGPAGGTAGAAAVAEPAVWAPVPADAPGPVVGAWRANHGETRFSDVNLGFRCRDASGATLVYSGDGEDGDDLRAAARAADLLLIECSTPDELATPGHLTPSGVAAICAAAAPRRVVLTHLYPPAAALDLPALVRRGWSGAVETARDGALYTVTAGGPGPPALPAAELPAPEQGRY